MNMLARKILLDDFNQMRNQSPESELKRKLMFRHRYPDETTLVTLKDKYNREYIFPTLDYVYEQSIEFYDNIDMFLFQCLHCRNTQLVSSLACFVVAFYIVLPRPFFALNGTISIFHVRQYVVVMFVDIINDMIVNGPFETIQLGYRSLQIQ